MNIEIINKMPNVKAVMTESGNGNIKIEIFEKAKKTLGQAKNGEVVKIGDREFIVLDHTRDTTAVITKEFAKKMSFGPDGDYRKSKVRQYCNGEFYDELVKAVGRDNIIRHAVSLAADDGTGKGISCRDNVSILTTEQYRRYREYLPAYGDWWWLATRVSADVSDCARGVRCVNSNGVLSWGDCGCSYGVRPFCILNSSVLIS